MVPTELRNVEVCPLGPESHHGKEILTVTSRATAAASAAAKSAAGTWATHARICAACRPPSTPAVTCPTGLRLWRDRQDTAQARAAERAADAAQLPGQGSLF